MRTFFRREMVIADSEQTIPSHDKLARLIAIIGERDDIEIVSDFAPVEWQSWSQIHDHALVSAVKSADQTTFERATIPASTSMVQAVAFDAGSMLAAACSAFEDGCAFSPTSGFHHAHWDRPGPLCLLNALPLTAMHVLGLHSIDRVLILDCDYHRGDGTDDILTRLGDDRIAHESLGYQFSRPKDSANYLSAIAKVSNQIERRNFDFIIYQAGMDVLLGDPAGGGLLTLDETKDRDSMVFAACRRASVPIVWNLAGGYPRDCDDGYNMLMAGHLSTIECAVKTFGDLTK